MSYELGQYFTVDETLQNAVLNFIRHSPPPTDILEPSVGQCHLLQKIVEKYPLASIYAYEIDEKLKPSFDITPYNIHIQYKDFLTARIRKKFPTIIGNPPYVKTSKGNLYIDFIDKCYDLLENNGEMIMIVPTDILRSTAGTAVRNKLLQNGSITDIFHPNNEHLFTYASVDVIVFRYEKSLTKDVVMYNGEERRLYNNGVITISSNLDSKAVLTNIGDIFDIYVGLVSGAEEIFKVSFGNVLLRNSETSLDHYILIKNFPSASQQINDHLLLHKKRLLSRRIRKFNENNWYQWGALRNFKKINAYIGHPCIYIKTLTRSTTVAFKGNVEYFGGSLIMLMVKPNLAYDVSLDQFVEYFNSQEFRTTYIQAGRFKIGHRQVSLATVELDG